MHFSGDASALSLRYPIVTQLPVDEAYRAPQMNNTQYQGLITAYSAAHVSITGGGTIDGAGWTWWKNISMNSSNLYYHQRPKLVEFVDCDDVSVSNVTLLNSPFWTLHPIFCTNVHLQCVVFPQSNVVHAVKTRFFCTHGHSAFDSLHLFCAFIICSLSLMIAVKLIHLTCCHF